ncbi:hypothetical protein EON65_33380 [archaeon]|nr:MAG: hypothetical protein EON65_33380 [archaeon]
MSYHAKQSVPFSFLIIVGDNFVFRVEQIFRNPDPKSRRTKMIFTLGPACWSVEGLVALIDAGMTIARFNFSHGTHEGHKATLDRLKEACTQRPGKHVAVMLGNTTYQCMCAHLSH